MCGMCDLRVGGFTVTAALVAAVARVAPASVRTPSGTSPDAVRLLMKFLPTFDAWQT
jgi:hypothetical protein